MNILLAATKFDKLCRAMIKKGQASTQLKDFANKLVSFNPEEFPGTSVDINAIHAAGAELNKSILSSKPSDILKELTKVLELTSDGGGSLYSEAKSLHEQVSKTVPKTPTWLDQYMIKEKKEPASWLSQYMTEEKASGDADEDIKGMQTSLEQGSSLKDML